MIAKTFLKKKNNIYLKTNQQLYFLVNTYLNPYKQHNLKRNIWKIKIEFMVIVLFFF